MRKEIIRTEEQATSEEIKDWVNQYHQKRQAVTRGIEEVINERVGGD